VTDRAIIVDRGYRPYEGDRLGTGAARRAIVREGYRRVLGLRRKARSKVFPWALIAFMVLLAALFVMIQWLAGDLTDELPGHGEYFDTISALPILFMALAAPQLLVPDRTQGVLSVYLSRPLRMIDYLGAKAAALGSLMMSLYLVPQVILYLGLAALSDDGFFGYLGANLDILWKVPTVALVYLALHGSLAFAIASYVPRIGFAAGTYLGAVIIANRLADFLSGADFAGARWFALLSFEQHPRVIRDWVFGLDGRTIMGSAGFDPWLSLVVVGAVTVLSGALIWAQYRRLP